VCRSSSGDAPSASFLLPIASAKETEDVAEGEVGVVVRDDLTAQVRGRVTATHGHAVLLLCALTALLLSFYDPAREVRVDVEIALPGRHPRWTSVERVLVDTGAEVTWLPEDVLRRLGVSVFRGR
jgi:hypothetical protein